MDAAQKATYTLNNLLKNSTDPVLFFVSGGSALPLLDGIDKNVLNKNIMISVLDERYSADPTINNFAQLTQTQFYKHAAEQGCAFIDTRIENNETKEQLAERWEHTIRNWMTAHPNHVLIATLGMGPDGHTAGIMPYPEDPETFKKLFANENRWIATYDAGDKNQYPLRITTTIPFLKMIDHAVFFATGENKKEVLLKVLEGTESPNTLPARVIKDMQDVQIFTDLNMI